MSSLTELQTTKCLYTQPHDLKYSDISTLLFCCIWNLITTASTTTITASPITVIATTTTSTITSSVSTLSSVATTSFQITSTVPLSTTSPGMYRLYTHNMHQRLNSVIVLT